MEEDQPRPRPRVKPTTVGEMGQRMLQGWTLLAEACPDCEVPLMRKGRVAPDMLCLNCEGVFLDNPEHGIVPAFERPGTPEKPRSDLPALKLREPSPPAPPLLPTTTLDISAKKEEKLQQNQSRKGPAGDALSTSSSGDAPSTSASGDAPSTSASGDVVRASDRPAETREQGERVASGANAGRQQGLQTLEDRVEGNTSGENAEGQQGKRTREDRVSGFFKGIVDEDRTVGLVGAGRGQVKKDEGERVSGALASKMLEGWTLLAEHCPICLTPLVRPRAGNMLCVGCNMPVQRESATAAAAAAPSPSPHPPQSLSGSSPPSAAPDAAQTVLAPAAATPSPHPLRSLSGSAPPSATPHAAQIVFAPAALPPHPGSGSGGPSQGMGLRNRPVMSEVWDAAELTLMEKMVEAQQKLAALPVEETAQCIAYMDVIAAAARGLKTVGSWTPQRAQRGEGPPPMPAATPPATTPGTFTIPSSAALENSQAQGIPGEGIPPVNPQYSTADFIPPLFWSSRDSGSSRPPPLTEEQQKKAFLTRLF